MGGSLDSLGLVEVIKINAKIRGDSAATALSLSPLSYSCRLLKTLSSIMGSSEIAAIAASVAAAVTVCTVAQFAYLHVLRSNRHRRRYHRRVRHGKPNRHRRRYQPSSPYERFEFKVENWLNCLIEKGFNEQGIIIIRLIEIIHAN